MGARLAGSVEGPNVSTGRAWYAVSILRVADVFSIMDRQISYLAGRADREVARRQRHADGLPPRLHLCGLLRRGGSRRSRGSSTGATAAWVIAIGIAIWSLATAAGGLATDYTHLLLARIAVAVGEAVLLPGAVSLIGDLFAPERRGRAMGAFGAAGPVGTGLGLIAGGLLLAAYMASPPSPPWVAGARALASDLRRGGPARPHRGGVHADDPRTSGSIKRGSVRKATERPSTCPSRRSRTTSSATAAR